MTNQFFAAMVLDPFVVYIVGMSLIVILAGIFCLSIWYYIKAKNLAPRLQTIKTLEDVIARLQKEILEKEQKLRDLQPKVVEAELKIERGKQAEEWLEKAKEEIETTQKLLAAIREEFERAKVQLEDLKRQISERQQQLVELEKKAVDAEKRVEDASKNAETIRKEYAELQVAVPRLQKELEGIEKELDAKKSLLEAVKNQFDDVTGQLNKAQGELERINGLIAVRKEELEKLSVEAARTRSEVAKLKGEENVAREVLAEYAKRREESGEKWKNLDAPMINVTSLRAPYEDMDEADWLHEFSKRLSNYGFIFDARAIYAFHTSLKCVRQTPLAVLSGISGTGKSLLPELYSAALGANFLSVPVQPRWDSPQDLFGFYNYMEGRYKATELARLLWQFDIYNNPKAGKWSKDGILPLNIVLLDEMNLARVEYYFSDLLSKLETRNGIDADNAIERRKAEIEIECNAADKIDSMRHLFVSPYTLFVGTMNEDESTQTLSDKVLDRANVLRFGLPKTLARTGNKDNMKNAPDKGGFIDSWREDGRICAVEWDVWCKPLSRTTEEREAIDFLNRTVQPVLMALDKVNRAYGYRVDQAMKLYVLNYPGDYRHAVSDQLEMKILPKLNGVELQDTRFNEVRSALQTAIDATGDDSLKNAFATSCNADAAFFKWRGVMR